MEPSREALRSTVDERAPSILRCAQDDRGDEIMTDELRVAVDRRGANGAILYTKGYINNVGGEEIANRAYELMDADVRALLLNLRETKIVNSIGISILIEIIEKMIDKGGKIGFCCLTPVIHKTFQIMGLANYAAIYNDEETAAREMGLGA
jgi:anti-anti-sigma factor